MKRIIPISIFLSILPGCFTVTTPETTNESNQEHDNSMNINTPPSISGTPTSAAEVGIFYTFTPSAEDNDGDRLTFSILNKPSWAIFDETTGELFGTPDDVIQHSNISIFVSDGVEETALNQFDIDVLATPIHSIVINWQKPLENTDGSSLSNIKQYKVSYGSSATQMDRVSYFDASKSSGVINDLKPGDYYFSMSTITDSSLVSDSSNTYYFQVLR